MGKEYTIRSTISTSNANIEIIKDGEIIPLKMSVNLTASVVKTKQSIFTLGRMFSNEITTALQGSGTLSVFEMYEVFGSAIKELITTGEDSRIEIKCIAMSDDNEFNKREVILKNVIFDSETLFNIDDMNVASIKQVPFTFSGLDFISDFNKGGK